MSAMKNAFHDAISLYCVECGSTCRCGDVLDPAAFGLHFDSWTGAYLDQFNDVWVSRPHGRKRWIVSFRDRGNVTRIVSRHHALGDAFKAASQVISEKRA